MTDDLVKRLRNIAVHSYLGRPVIEEAADRIYALTADRENRLADLQIIKAERDAAYAQGYSDAETEISKSARGQSNAFLHSQYTNAAATIEALTAERDRLRAALEDIADHDTGATAGLAYTAIVALKGETP